MSNPVRTAIIGAGGMFRHHLPRMLELNTEITVLCEPSVEQYQLTAEKFKSLKTPVPPNEPDLAKLLTTYAGKLDAAFIITPHAYHHDQTKACLEAGLDVLLEKPMVMNAQEALSLIDIRDKTGKLLVVAFQGGLSPQIRYASALLRSGDVGDLLTISGNVWQNWKTLTVNTWRQDPPIAGGGFLFDTGAHMLNTLSDLVGEEFEQVAAWFDNRGAPVDILAAVMARTVSGALITINACGDAIPSCTSYLRVFTTQAIIDTGQWGERLSIMKHGETEFTPIDVPPMQGAWEQFLAVRTGDIENPCPPEVGLRMARLWDAIRLSAARGGMPINAATLTPMLA
jgi:predicted dehydrogenase